MFFLFEQWLEDSLVLDNVVNLHQRRKKHQKKRRKKCNENGMNLMFSRINMLKLMNR